MKNPILLESSQTFLCSMRVVLTNLSNKLYERSRFRLNDSALKHGIKEINSFDFEDLKSTSFYQENQKLLGQPKGIGYWSWKPYIILETMKSLSENDVVIYSDCGIEIIKDLGPLINICKNEAPVLLFANANFKNKTWIKRDCFILMHCDSKEYWNGQHCDAAFSLFRKSKESRQFLHEWLHYCCVEQIISSSPNGCGKKNIFGFLEHRWDQSILSLLAIKHRIEFYRMPTQFGNHYKILQYRTVGEFNCINQLNQKQVSFYSKNPSLNSSYYQLLNHHRSKNNSDIETSKKIMDKNRFIGIVKSKINRVVHLIGRA